MGWDRIEYHESAACPCGKGRLTRTTYREDDDWNRSRSGALREAIECPDCAKKYHIEHLIQHFFQPKWVGSGVSDTTYLVENDYSLQHKTSVKELRFFHAEEEIVSQYTKDELLRVIDEMGTVRFSTQLQLSPSREVVDLYYERYKKRSLQPIIVFLKDCVDRYDTFEWNPMTVEAYYAEQKRLADEGRQRLDDALKHAVEVQWERE